MSCSKCSGSCQKKRRSKAKRSRSNRKSRISLPLRYFGVGGRPTLPSEYFGGKSGRYLATGNHNLSPCPLNVPVSHGTLTSDDFMGPDLHSGPYPVSNQSAGSRNRRRRSRSQRSQCSQRKKQKHSQRKNQKRSQHKNHRHKRRN